MSKEERGEEMEEMTKGKCEDCGYHGEEIVVAIKEQTTYERIVLCKSCYKKLRGETPEEKHGKEIDGKGKK